MTLVTITLSEGEQEVLVKNAEFLQVVHNVSELAPWFSIAEKIRRAQEDEWGKEFNIPPVTEQETP